MKIFIAIILLIIMIFIKKKENFQIPKINKINSVTVGGEMPRFKPLVMKILKPLGEKTKEKVLKPFIADRNQDNSEKEFGWFL